MSAGPFPRISVLVLNYNGRSHLEHCLPSLAAQTYPRERYRVEVIDNGSTDDSVKYVRTRHPDVVLHRRDRNDGFAAPYDEAVRASDSELVALLNNDTRVEPAWLAELASAAQRHGAHAVASRILDWDGTRVDFVGGTVSFVGHAWQRDHGEPADRQYDERPLLFACGGSMLVSRDAYVSAGGFDPDFFAYFEDVDLGWRMSLLGYKIVLAPRAVTYHRLHGTAGRVPFAQRLRLFERNALAMIYKNYEEETLQRVFPAAIALSLARGLAPSGLDPRQFAFDGLAAAAVSLPAQTAVHLLALEDFCRQLPSLRQKRAEIQRRRTVPDREVTALFGDPFRLHAQGAYAEVARALIRDFDIEGLFAGPAGPSHTTRPRAAEPAVALPAADRGRDATRLLENGLPTVSIVILTMLGATHLTECLGSLGSLTYPRDRIEVIVVDNGSADDPTAIATALYPGARVIRNTANLGFAAGNNVGARAAGGEYVVFLNDDTRVHPEWLGELVATALRHRAAIAGSRILSWDRRLIDFAGGAVNCEGRGFQVDHGLPEAGRHMAECPLLFACGAALLARRDVLLESGGWDEGTFAYYEDVELGWRLWLLGHEVWYSPKSVVYHQHHGTTDRWPAPPRLRLYERNALRMLYTHLERPTLERVLPAALLLSADRVLLATDLSRASDPVTGSRNAGGEPVRRPSRLRRAAASARFALAARGARRDRSIAQNLRRVGPAGLLGAAWQVVRDSASSARWSRRGDYEIERGTAPLALDGRLERIPVGAAAALCGLQEFLDSVPRLGERRRMLQASRQRSDDEILSRFGAHWLSPCGAPHGFEHEALHRVLMESLGIAAPDPDGVGRQRS